MNASYEYNPKAKKSLVVASSCWEDVGTSPRSLREDSVVSVGGVQIEASEWGPRLGRSGLV